MTSTPSRADDPPHSRSGSPPPPPARRRLRLPGLRVTVACSLAFVAFVGFGVWALYGSPWLRVEKVSVDGTAVLTAEEVREAAAVAVGTPLASVDKAAAQRRVTEALPRVDSVRVVRSWPSGIGLHVTERTPVLAQKRAGGEYVEIDAGGVRYAKVDKRPKGKPLLVVDREKSADAKRFGPRRLRQEAAAVADALPGFVARDVRTVRVRSYDSISLELTGNRVVMWGSGEYGAAKARTLRALLKAHHKDSAVRYFDVSVPSAPAAAGS
ncbi:FtsQ-type POTRA domain-containing protein [Streptomyces sp. P38-E01]|uniref:Cell division protein FtsQ n=1 Tax=Streptomyces tardus TaxID=2780544 RepID=A0A949JSX8_9ACTN|nr:FtsQ-type POTRA domain-containing protein [Streptomyces tardus]MBU7599560.1 FtsQ-type POTRA domain-containing protein [Streptomyces tardus]